MLVELAIRDIVLIDRLSLGFAAGMSVLTGETGAGKSILLDAFALALGGRGDGSLVRHGQAQGQVTAVFSVSEDHPVLSLLHTHEIACEGDLILRRIQMADGRTRALVNDQAVSVQVLKALGERLVEIHGQHDDRALADVARHRDLLDAFGQHGHLVAAVQRAAAVWSKARAALEEHKARVEALRKEGDYLRHASEELEKLGAEPGEESDLALRRQTMMASEKIASDLNEAVETMSGDGSPIPLLSAVLRRLQRREREAPDLVKPSLEALDAALDAVEQARQRLEEARRLTDFNPKDLEQVEERLFALRAASRKYDVPVDELAALAVRYADDLLTIDVGEQDLRRLRQELEAAEADYIVSARALSDARQAAARALEHAVAQELPPLKLERARFLVMLDTDEDARQAAGFDRVEFWVETNPGTKPGPMMKVASGGELSRFLLALKVCLADRGSAPTLVFDEIDTGVGGAVADAIGQRLGRLAQRVQVLAVTHAPQVAARAQTHFLIAKDLAAEGHVATSVTPLDEKQVQEELARMLAGDTITKEARAAARALRARAREGG